VAPRPAGHSGADDEAAYQARVRAWVERTCAEQGVPVKIADPLTLRKIGDILNQARQRGDKRDSSKRL
jgi:hypothetical protein